MAYNRLDTKYKAGQVWDEAAISHIDDVIEALDGALGTQIVEVEKVKYSSNRFDKNTIPFIKGFYQGNSLPTNLIFPKPNTSFAGAGWTGIPVESGKTYTMSINPVTLTDMDNKVYGVFCNLWFVDRAGKIIATCPANGSNFYSTNTSVNPNQTLVQSIAYDSAKVKSYDYTGNYNYMNGMFTNTVTFEIKEPNITHMHVQIGSSSFGMYQIDSNFNTRGHLTDAEAEQLINSFQINEGTKLLEYEEGGDVVYYENEVQSNLTKLQSAFTLKPIPSSNLLNPAMCVRNHKYVNNQSLTAKGQPSILTYERAALLELTFDSPGKYFLYSQNSKMPFGNKTFGLFGNCIFTDENDVLITCNYGYAPAAGVATTIDTSKVIVYGFNTNMLTFDIIDENIKKVFIPLLDSDKNTYGLWTNYEITTGLTDEELHSLLYQMQFNKNILEEWEAFENVTYQSKISPEFIDGLDTFKEDMEQKITESLLSMSPANKSMSCVISGNHIYVRSNQFTPTNSFVWKLEKVASAGGNKYFNIATANTCSSHISNEHMISTLTQWKNCGDDIAPMSIMGTYIGANHGSNCVDKLTVTGHNKTEADIGSIWLDSADKTYVLTHIYDENTIGLVKYDSKSMSSGRMEYGNPAIGSTITHQAGATNTSDIVVEARVATQLWQCFNKYNIKLLVDGVEKNLEEDCELTGDRIEILTQYNVIFVPAMLTYLMNNVGNNTSDSQHSDEIEDYYMTVYIDYQFNRNGSISTYSSFYANKNIGVDYISLVQSSGISTNPYEYVPDTTTYQIPSIHDESNHRYVYTEDWTDTQKAPYRFYQFADDTFDKGIVLAYDRSIGWGNNEKRVTQLGYTMRYANTKKMYPCFCAGCTIPTGTFFDGLAARVPLYKVDPDITSVGWYWCSDDIILMIDTHNAINKDIILPDYMNNMRVEKLDISDSCNVTQTYIFNNKLRFQCTDYGYAVLRLYK